MMVINNNLPALNAYDIVNNTSNQLQKSIQKLSTGLRINSAADDAAGLSISEKMRAQINGLDQAVRNTQDGISLIQTAEGALTETHSILQRMRELSVQAANDTYTAQDRSYIQEEMDLLRDEIDHIGNTTTFNTKKLLNGDSAVLWSSDNLNTKALVRGGLRNIDQFGQKSSSEGNYKITVAAEAGTGEVQKSDILKIKHDLDPYAIEGTNKFDGAALDGTADFDAVGSRTVDVTVYARYDTAAGTADYRTYTVTLNGKLDDNAGLAEALNLALTGNTAGGAIGTSTSATAAYDAKGSAVTTAGVNATGATINGADFVASVDGDGNLVITSATGNAIEIKDGKNDDVNDLKDVFGATTNTGTLRTQNSGTVILNGDYTNSSATNTATLSLTVGSQTTASNIDISGNVNQNTTTIAEAVSALNTALDGVYGEGNVVASYSGNKITLTSSIGAIRNVTAGAFLGTTSNTAAATYTGSTYTNKTTSANSGGNVTTIDSNTIDAALQETDFTHTVAGSSIKITLADTSNTSGTITLDDSDTVKDIDTLVKNLNDKIAVNNDLAGKISARKVTDSSGNEQVRLFSDYAFTIEDNDPTTTPANSGSANAIFGTDMDYSSTTAPGTSKTGTGPITSGIGTIEDMLSLTSTTDTFALKIKDLNDEELGSIKVTGPYRPTVDNTTGEVTKTAAEKLVEDINTQLKSQNLDDFKALYNSDTGAVSIVSGIRDFVIEDDTSDASYKGLADLLGKSTVSGAEKSKTLDNPVESIGMVAAGETVLRDIDKFWDSQGNFLLEDPQTITITQGDGQSTKVTLYKYDTVDDMVSKFNNAIANDLGQAKYLDETDKNYQTALNSFVTFVEKAADVADGEQPGQESVQGTMLIRTVAPGSTGTINFASNNEDLINALSLNTIQKADDSKYHVTVQDAHSGVVVNNIEDEKITNNVLVGRLHQNVDVEFNAMTGITATWDDENKQFVLKGAYDDTKDMSKGEVTYLHLTDNTMVFQIGANEGDDMGINIGDMRSHALGLDKVLVTDHASASRSISIIDSAIDKVSTQRAKLGAYQNRLEHTAANLTTSAENLTAAESRIRDTDMAKTMMDFTKLQIMLQAGNSMLAQANQLPQNVLSLIR